MKKIIKLLLSFMIMSIFIVSAEDLDLVWNWEDGKRYWYENNIKQGTYEDPKCVMGDGTCRGREIYDKGSDGWYWLDSIYDGAKAENKEVWIPYIYQDEDKWKNDEDQLLDRASFSYAEITRYNEISDMRNQIIKAIKENEGKWVRYDKNGKMYKGWYDDSESKEIGNIYFYDYATGAMAKGDVHIGYRTYHFDEITGILDLDSTFDFEPLEIVPMMSEEELWQRARELEGSREGACEYMAWKLLGDSNPSVLKEVYDPRPGDIIRYYDANDNYRHTAVYLNNTTAFHGNYIIATMEARIAGINLYSYRKYYRQEDDPEKMRIENEKLYNNKLDDAKRNLHYLLSNHNSIFATYYDQTKYYSLIGNNWALNHNAPSVQYMINNFTKDELEEKCDVRKGDSSPECVAYYHLDIEEWKKENGWD